MATTWAAYIYDAASGLAKRVVVSDDYRTPAALMAAHCAPGEAALVEPYAGALEENKVAMAIRRLDDDGVQDIVTAHCKIAPPPKLRYALTGPTGRVFEVVETRVPADPRLQRHAAFEAAKVVKQTDMDAALAIVAQWPDLDLLLPRAITQQMRDAHNLVGKARYYGLIADDVARIDPSGEAAIKVADRSAGFSVHRSAAVAVGDEIKTDGTIRKAITAPLPAEVPIIGDTRIVL